MFALNHSHWRFAWLSIAINNFEIFYCSFAQFVQDRVSGGGGGYLVIVVSPANQDDYFHLYNIAIS